MKDAFSRFISKIKVYWSIGPQPWISVVNINEWANHQCNISPTHSHMHTHTHTQAHHAQLLLKTSHLYTYPHPLPSGKTTVNIQGIKCWVIQLWVVCWPSRPSHCPPPPPQKKKKSPQTVYTPHPVVLLITTSGMHLQPWTFEVKCMRMLWSFTLKKMSPKVSVLAFAGLMTFNLFPVSLRSLLCLWKWHIYSLLLCEPKKNSSNCRQKHWIADNLKKAMGKQALKTKIWWVIVWQYEYVSMVTGILKNEPAFPMK